MQNILLASDSYKYTHWKQYPPRTQQVYSYLESRGGAFPETVFFGLQYYLKEYLAGQVVTTEKIIEAKELIDEHLGPGMFDTKMWHYILTNHDGKLPVRIRAVPEGTVVPTGNVLITIENTDYNCPALTNFLETMLLKVWYPTTVATQSREIKKLIAKFLEETGDPNGLPFKLHDFGYRGVSSEESAGLAGAAHLVNFMGTDTLAAILYAKRYYGAMGMPAFSVPAMEHSTVTSWGKDREADAYANMIESFPNGIISIVVDSYDTLNAVDELIGNKLKEKVLARDGTLVVRPDSGVPEDVVFQIARSLEKRFGAEENAKGFKVLNPKVRIIQGDGINRYSIQAILEKLMKGGYSADNVVFGMGGALLQQVNRDTQKFAIKCSNIMIDGIDHPVFKEPKLDSGKNSKPGRLALVKNGDGFHTIKNPFGNLNHDDLLKTVFLDGDVKFETTFEEVRERAAL
jgi:nicotinamide phosphoribosyltransferase